MPDTNYTGKASGRSNPEVSHPRASVKAQFREAVGYPKNHASGRNNPGVNGRSGQVSLHQTQGNPLGPPTNTQNPRQSDIATNQGLPAININQATTEAQLRMALDLLQHAQSASTFQSHHQNQKAELLRRIQAISVQNHGRSRKKKSA